MTTTSESLPGVFVTSALTKYAASDGAKVDTTDIEYSSKFGYHDFAIHTNRNVPTSHKSLTFALDDDIKSGDYPIGVPDQPFFAFSYLERPSGSNGAGILRQYEAIAGGTAQVTVLKHEHITHYCVTFEFTGKHQDGEEVHIKGSSDIHLKVYAETPAKLRHS
jgi:hypothetical protein